jgi:magnesium-transporting ATPase (P-type)
MLNFALKRAINYLLLIALFLVTFLAIHSMASIVLGLLSDDGFKSFFGSGLIIFTLFATISLAVLVSIEYRERQEKLSDYYLSTK